MVRQIDFRGVAGTDHSHAAAPAAHPRRRAAHREQLQQSLRDLYATGRFATLEVEADTVPGGIVLTYVAKENYFNGQIRVQGLNEQRHPPRPSDLVNATRLDLGELFSEDNVQSGLSADEKGAGRQRLLRGDRHLPVDAA